MRRTRKLGAFLPVAVALLPGCAPEPPDPAASAASPAPFTETDQQAVRALEESYRTAWLRDDTSAVLSLFTDDAVIMPAGVEPMAGRDALRAYWWPDDGSRTTIDRYEIEVVEVEGSGDLAFVRGRGALDFRYTEPGGKTSELASRSVFLSVARRGEDGRWEIARRAWSALR